MALHQFNIFWQIAFWPTRRERMTRGIPSLLLRTEHLVQWTLKYGETWETSLRNLMTTRWGPVSVSVSVSNTNVSDWDLRYRSEPPSPGQLHQSIIEQSQSQSSTKWSKWLLTVSISGDICPEQRDLRDWERYDCVIETKARFPSCSKHWVRAGW